MCTNIIELICLTTPARFFLALLLCGLSANTESQAQNFWQQTNGPTGGTIRALAINNSNGHIFAGTLGGGVFRSMDNGNNWTAVNTGLTNTDISSLAINSSGHIFAGNRSGVFRSVNNGDNWSLVNTGLKNAGTSSFAINNSNGNIFAGSADSGVFRSMNNGDNWMAVNTGLTNTKVQSLAINPTTRDIFAGTAAGVFRSLDNGDNWRAVNAGLTNVQSLAINSSGHIFAGTASGGVFRSMDNGDNWTPVNAGLTNTNVQSLAINSSGHIFAGTSGGVFSSMDNGNTWMHVLSGKNVKALASNSSGHIFAGTIGDGVYRSTDDVNSWTPINNGLANTEVRSLASNSGGAIFAGTLRGLFRSMNNGGSWEDVTSGSMNNTIEALAINASGNIFAGTAGGGVYRSTNNGGNWVPVNTGLTNTKVLSLIINNSNGDIFAGTDGGGVFRSTDNASSWMAIGLPNTKVRSLAINSSGHIFAGTLGGVFRSMDNGGNWKDVNSGLNNTDVRALAINSSGHIFAGTEGGGVFRSTDNGGSWTQGLTNTKVRALAINSSGHIFTGTFDSGVFRSMNNGSSWGGVNAGLTTTSTDVLSLNINSSEDIFAGTGGNGVFRSVGSTTSLAPTVTTSAATNVSSTSATLNGTVNANGLSTTIKFDYGTTTSYGDTILATQSPVMGTSIVSVSASLSGLSPNTLYHYRVVATNSAGTTNGADQIFTTIATGTAPSATTNAATNVSSTSATLNGTVNPNGLSTTVKFEYGTTTSYGIEVTAMPSPVTGTNSVSVSAALTGLAPNTLYHFRVVGTNNAGTTNGADQTLTTQAVDQSPPQITHSAVTSTPTGQSQMISATLTDNVGVQSAILFYRQGGVSSFTSTAMTNTSGAIYQGTIPAGSITERGAEYYISAQDAAGNLATFPTTNPQTKPVVIQVTTSNLAFANPTPPKAYRMISVPFDLNDKSPAGVFEDDLGRYDDTQWRLLRYVNGANVEFDSPGFASFAPGTGFWLITKEAKTLDAGAGKSVTTGQNYIITLPPNQWSQIGNPFAFTVNWSALIKNGTMDPRLVGYQGSLNEATGYDYTRTQLVPFEGYFVKNMENNSITIEIPPTAVNGTSANKQMADWKSALRGNEWALQITAASGRYLDKDNYLGCLNSAADTWDANDFSEAPFFDQHVALYFPHPEWKKYPDLYTGDFRAVKVEGDYWDFVVKSEVGRSEVAKSEVILKLADLQNLPADWEIILLDKTSRVAINFNENKQYTFPSEGGKTVREFRIVVGKKDFVETNDLNLSGVPQAFALGQNYPNPFWSAATSPAFGGGNPETRINYELPFTHHVKISVYNLNGQLIRTLFDGEQSAGRYTVSWNGTNVHGDRVASGVYLVRMEAGDPFDKLRVGASTGSEQRFAAVRKAILVR